MISALIRSLSAPAELLLIVAVCAGWFIYASVQAMLAGFPIAEFSDGESLSLVVFEVTAFAFAAVILRIRGWTAKDFNLALSWSGILVGALLYGVSLIIWLAIWSLLDETRSSAREYVTEMASAEAVTLPIAVALSLVNGAFEEFLLAGYLLKALQPAGAGIALGLSGLIRLSYHLYQGPLGALYALAFGLLVTGYYWRFRQLWPVISAHAIADFLALV